MSSSQSVAIIGGGISGLSAAVFLAQKDFKVTMYESSPKIGGRAYSFFDKERNMFFDNGQHIIAGWYRNTLEYLKLTGSYDKLNIQKELEVNFISGDRKIHRLRCPDTAPPMNLIMGLLKFDALKWKDKFALNSIKKLLKGEYEFETKYDNAGSLLKGIRQTGNLIKYFWEPFILAVFNTIPEKVSVEVFLNVIRLGFVEKNNSTLVIPDTDLNELLINNALKYLENRSSEVYLNKRIKQVVTNEQPDNMKVEYILTEDDEKIYSDHYVSAVPFFTFKKLFSEDIYYRNSFKSESLKASSIVSVHIFTEERIPEEMIPSNSFGMTGLIGTIVQWIFKRSDNHLSLVISGADDLQITDMSNEDIFNICIKDLGNALNNFSKIRISGYKVIKEKRATFIPDNESIKLRPNQKTVYRNFYIAGDWTDTGMPATIESAVTSARICSDLINY
jgi:squalene-associated FAD-dependent desaturase